MATDITYEPRGKGWRGRGRPRAQADPKLVDVLLSTLDSGSQAKVPLGGATDAEIKATVRALKRAADACGPGTVLRWQRIGDNLAFYIDRDTR